MIGFWMLAVLIVVVAYALFLPALLGRGRSYPDNAHFIYELLQNAEDPEATEVQFTWTDSGV
jgi:hypothetical protein